MAGEKNVYCDCGAGPYVSITRSHLASRRHIAWETAHGGAQAPQGAASDAPDVAEDIERAGSALGRGPGLDPPEDDDPGPRHSSLGMGPGGKPPEDDDQGEPRPSAVGSGDDPPADEDEPPRSGLGMGPGGEPEVQAANWPYSDDGIVVRTRRNSAMDIIVPRAPKQGGDYHVYIDPAGAEFDNAVAKHLLATRPEELVRAE